jgi:endo-1,4-beta-xylanase
MLRRTIRSVAVLLLIVTALTDNALTQPLATGKGKFLGSCIGFSIRSDFSKYWNQATPENAGKWGSVEGTQDAYNWTLLDNIYNYAISNGFLYRHHTLVWGQQAPSWITALDSANQRAQVEEWIRLVGERYPKIDFIDVVNEPFNAPAPYRNALGGNGATGWDWVITAFQWARKYCPTAKLHINEYNILQSNLVTDKYAALIDTLKVRGLIDGIGIQGHYFELRYYAASTLQNNLNRLAAATGLPIYITEFDIDESDNSTQLQKYQTYFPIFWDNPAVKGITLWGYAENAVWKPYAFVIDYRGAPRPSLQWLSKYVAGPARPIPVSPLAFAVVPRNPKLVWRSSASASSYSVQIAEDSTFSLQATDATVSDTVFQPNPLRPNTTHYWRVNATNQYGTSEYSLTGSFVTNSTVVGIEDEKSLPNECALYQNYPNPFNPSTSFEFQVSRYEFVSLNVLDVLGRVVATLVHEYRQPGVYSIRWNALGLPSGVYFYRLRAGDFVDTKKLILSK